MAKKIKGPVLEDYQFFDSYQYPELKNIPGLEQFEQRLRVLEAAGMLSKVARTKPFKPLNSTKTSLLAQWLMYCYGKYPAPKWFQVYCQKRITLNHVAALLNTESFEHRNLLPFRFQQQIPVRQEHEDMTRQMYASVLTIVALMHMNGKSPYKDGVKLLIKQIAGRTYQKLQAIYPEVSQHAIEKYVQAQFPTKKELHAMLTCPYSFEGNAESFYVWGYGSHLQDKGSLKRLADIFIRKQARPGPVALRQITEYFCDTSGDIERKRQDVAESAQRMAKLAAEYAESGLDVHHFPHLRAKQKDRWVQYRQDLSSSQISDLIDYLVVLEPQNLQNAVRKQVSSLQDDQHRWHRQLRQRKEMDRPEHRWDAWFPEWGGIRKVNAAKDTATWYRVTELLNGRALSDEGAAMHHCVGSYVSYCLNDRCRIFSFTQTTQLLNDGVEILTEDKPKRIATLEVALNGGAYALVQAKKFANQACSDYELSLIGQWAREQRISMNL